MLATFRFHALRLLKGLIKHWIQGIKCLLSLVCYLLCMWGQHFKTEKNNTWKWKFKVHSLYKWDAAVCLPWLKTLIICRTYTVYHCTSYMFYDLYVNMFYGLCLNMQTEEDPGETDWNKQACSLVWPWPLSGVDIFQSVIKWPLKPFPWFIKLLQQFVSACTCLLKSDMLQPISCGGSFVSFHAENYKTVDSHGFAKCLKLDSVLIKVAWHRLPLLHPAKKREKNNDEELYCESASKQRVEGAWR